MNESKKYINPYFAGFILGLLILASYFFTGDGLGASGAYKRAAAKLEGFVAPSYVENPESSAHKYFTDGQDPLKNRLVFMVLGAMVGGFVSGAFANRLKIRVEHSPKITAKTRLIAALIGGALFGMGASFARGCTSGAGLNGMATLATSGFVVVMAIFGMGYAVAYFFRKLWI